MAYSRDGKECRLSREPNPQAPKDESKPRYGRDVAATLPMGPGQDFIHNGGSPVSERPRKCYLHVWE